MLVSSAYANSFIEVEWQLIPRVPSSEFILVLKDKKFQVQSFS
jgi:hypothetical protein